LVVDPGGSTGQLTFDAFWIVLFDVAVHLIQPLAPVSGMPLAQLIEPLAARIGALMLVTVVVVVTVMMLMM
jgi:hypothetical protein